MVKHLEGKKVDLLDLKKVMTMVELKDLTMVVTLVVKMALMKVIL